jgi:signal peptidase I
MLRWTLAAAGVLAALAAWWAVAPPQLGGSTTLVSVDGTSMLPNYNGSDLVALRPRADYEVGDVVGYRSKLLHRVVMHRIVAIKHGRYVMKGDNNTFIDPERPETRELVGAALVRIPRAGDVILWLRVPVVLAGLVGVLTLMVGLGVAPRTQPE